MGLSAIGASERGQRSDPALPLLDAHPIDALRVWFGELAKAGGLQSGAVRRRPFLEAAGCVASEPVIALHADPVGRCAAMDGIAVRTADATSATDSQPVTLDPGCFAIIDTGQAVADRWDAIIPNELLEHDGAGIVLRAPVAPGQHIRPAGENVDRGARIIDAGRRLTAYDIALAAACGHTELAVHAGPRVVVIPTGNEIRPIGTRLAAGEAIDASSTMLSILLRDAGATVSLTPIVPDGAELLENQLRRSCCAADLVLIIAGSARGTRDRTASVIASLGSTVVRGIALRPAHPVILGRVGPVAVVGLPGYPVSTAFAFERFVRPLLQLLSGVSSVTDPIRLRVRLASAVRGRLDAEVQVPVSLDWASDDVPEAYPRSRRGSALASLARAHAVVSVPMGVELLAAGEVVYADLLPALPAV